MKEHTEIKIGKAMDWEPTGHTLDMSWEQVDFRMKWKKQHGRMKGANQAYKRHIIRQEAK